MERAERATETQAGPRVPPQGIRPPATPINQTPKSYVFKDFASI